MLFNLYKPVLSCFTLQALAHKLLCAVLSLIAGYLGKGVAGYPTEGDGRPGPCNGVVMGIPLLRQDSESVL